ncbi:MAG TPA: peptidoglycan-binding domain-containing protein [Desulfuromonadales bacterium]|nr:peptidoglycan-binding domain-containing protein [Desulfuromonadales bacterium]
MKHLVLFSAMAVAGGLFLAGQALSAGSGHMGGMSQGMSQPASGSAMGTTMQQRTMAQHLNHEQVREMQTILNQKGYQVGTTDGMLGPRTSSALRQFQQSNGLAVTGEPNQETLRALAPADKQNFFGLSPAYNEMEQQRTQEHQQMQEQQRNQKQMQEQQMDQQKMNTEGNQ